MSYLKKLLHAMRSPALKLLWQESAGQRGRVLLLSVLASMGAVLSLSMTLLVRELVDSATGGDAAKMRLYALGLAGLIAFQLLFGYVRRMVNVHVRAGLLQRMRSTAMHRLLHKQYAGLRRYHSGEVVNRLFSDVNVVTDGILGTVPPLLYLTIQLVGASIILYRMNSSFMFILLVAGMLGAAASFAFKPGLKKLHKQSQQAEDKLHARVQETLGSMRIIKASGTEAKLEHLTSQAQQFFTNAQLRRGRFSAIMNTGIGLVFQGSWLYAMIWGCTSICNGTLTYGGLAAILQLVGQIQSPFEGFISTLGTMYGAISSAERLLELYSLPDDVPQQDFHAADDQLTAIRLSHLSFAYDRETVLHDLSLQINAGDTMAIMGQSGCGKSTLFQLLLGIYQPSGGSIETCLSDRTVPGSMHGLYAYVPQGNELFSGTIRENLSLFCNHVPTDEELWQAARMACLEEFIRSQADGLDTRVGEHGIGLSEGQAQRVAIARSLMTDCPVLLLDESTSALDEETEARVLQNIASLSGRTCLIVTHRRAALAICNRTVRIENGVVHEAGAQNQPL